MAWLNDASCKCVGMWSGCVRFIPAVAGNAASRTAAWSPATQPLAVGFLTHEPGGGHLPLHANQLNYSGSANPSEKSKQDKESLCRFL